MSQINVKKYLSKPTTVEAVQITEENMSDVAKWCNGQVRLMDENNEKKAYIKVKVWRAQSDKLSQGFVGDWILKRGTGYKVYTDKAFKNGYTDGAVLPMVEDEEMQNLDAGSVFNSMIQERTTPRETKVDMGPGRTFTSSTPPAGVPMRGPEYGFPEGSVVVFDKTPSRRTMPNVSHMDNGPEDFSTDFSRVDFSG